MKQVHWTRLETNLKEVARSHCQTEFYLTRASFRSSFNTGFWPANRSERLRVHPPPYLPDSFRARGIRGRPHRIRQDAPLSSRDACTEMHHDADMRRPRDAANTNPRSPRESAYARTHALFLLFFFATNSTRWLARRERAHARFLWTESAKVRGRSTADFPFLSALWRPAAPM